MKNVYTLSFILSVLFASCFPPRVSYLGSPYAPTQNVDVYVQEQSIKSNYEIIGKGYLSGYSFKNYINKVQKKSIEVAKAKGANAVLIQDYYVPNTGTSIQTTSQVDSVGKGVVAVSNTNIHPTGTAGFTIYFLKYK